VNPATMTPEQLAEHGIPAVVALRARLEETENMVAELGSLDQEMRHAAACGRMVAYRAEKPAHPCSRWCFGCRKHLPHSLVLLGDVLLGDEEPGWYDPVAVVRCSGCGQDRTRFPS
jgi:hypothetical protein